jgi:hypothetical protein
MEQAQKLTSMARIGLYLDLNVLAITPDPWTPRKTTTVIPEISPASGLVGYPSFNRQGVVFSTLQSSTDIWRELPARYIHTKAAGPCFAMSISHSLESQKPGGKWFSSVIGTR